jgi:hypothetical protein
MSGNTQNNLAGQSSQSCLISGFRPSRSRLCRSLAQNSVLRQCSCDLLTLHPHQVVQRT